MLSVEDAEELTGFGKLRVSRMRKRISDPAAYKQRLYGAAWRGAFPELADEAHLATGTGDNEWYTPQKYIKRLVSTALRERWNLRFLLGTARFPASFV